MAARQKSTEATPTGDYEVGYGKPPKHTRFGPGNSANPRGRPKGAKNKVPAFCKGQFDHVILAEAYRQITINERDGSRVTMPTVQAFMRMLSMNALQGRARAQKLFSDLLASTERRTRAEHDRFLEEAIAYKKEGRALLDECLSAGKRPPEMVPHPDDIIVDVSDNSVRVIGPMTPEDKANWEILAERREQGRTLLAELASDLEAAKGSRRRKILRDAIASVSDKLEETVSTIGEWPKHQRNTLLPHQVSTTEKLKELARMQRAKMANTSASTSGKAREGALLQT